MPRLLAAVLAALLSAVAGCGQTPSERDAARMGAPAETADAGDGTRPEEPPRLIVTAANAYGWAFQVADPRGSPSGVGMFVSGPATPPCGSGSARLATGSDGTQGVFLSLAGYAGQRLADLMALSYSTYATQWNGQQIPFLVLYLDLDLDDDADDALFFEPAYQTPASGSVFLPDQGAARLGAWQPWDAIAGGWWSLRGYAEATPGTGVKGLGHYLSLYPRARIANARSGAGGIRLAVGLAEAQDTFEGYVDDVTIAFSEKEGRYDFEPGGSL